MGIFDLFRKAPETDVDYVTLAENFEKQGDYNAAIQQYEELIKNIYSDKPESRSRYIRRKIINCYMKLGNYEKVLELWSSQFDPLDYGAKEMYELVKILENAQKMDLVEQVYNLAGRKLIRNKIEFLVKQKKIPEANRLISELLANMDEKNPSIEGVWLQKAKLSMSLLKWEEANRYLNKILEKNSKNMEARRLKEFCIKHARE